MSYPRLYEATEAAKTNKFETLGVGTLSDAVSCVVTEERNGEFELEMEYPISGIHFGDITVDRLIVSRANEKNVEQIFRIYKIEKPIDGVVTVYAEHISYLLNKAVVVPFSTSMAASALSSIPNFVQWDTDNPYFPAFPFDFWTDVEKSGEFVMETPATVRSILGGTDGSILDTFGGEYEFDNFTVKLWNERGSDRNVYLRYGKNITDLKSTDDISNTYTGVLPYWKGTLTREVWNSNSGSMETESYDELIYLDGDKVAWSDYVASYGYPQTNVVDFSSEIENNYADVKDGDETTHYTDVSDIKKALKEKAEAYVTTNKGWEPANNIEVSFVQLWDTPEYENFSALQKVNLCDTVHVVYPTLNIDVSMKVITTEYNVLLERYDKIELGEAKSSMTSSIINNNASTNTKLDELDKSTKSSLQKAKEEATNLINGKLDAFRGLAGGHFIFETNDKGQVEEIYCISGDSKETSDYVLRINLKGIAFSTNGWDGPYNTAWDINSNFVADYITSGTLSSILIKACTLMSQDGTMSIDMNSNAFRMNNGGTFQINDYSGSKVLALQNGSSGWGLYAKTFDGEEGYWNKGNSTWNSVFINGSTGSGVDAAKYSLHVGGSNDGGGYFYAPRSGACEYVGSDFWVTATFHDNSDARTKTGVESIADNDALDFIMSLRPRSFRYIFSQDQQSYGFIAQEVMEHLPEKGGIIAEREFINEKQESEGTRYGLSYLDFIPFLVSVAQQQERRITELEERLKTLEDKINGIV